MIRPNREPYLAPTGTRSEAPLVLPLAAVTAGMLPLIGGKGASLGNLLHAEFPVPDGFCVTTAAYDLVSRNAGLNLLLNALAATCPADVARLERQAAEARAAILAAVLP